MRTTQILALSLLLLLPTGCRKQDSSERHGCEPTPVSSKLYGNWKIVRVAGGISGMQEIRNFDRLRLGADDTFTLTCLGNAVKGGSYCTYSANHSLPNLSGVDYVIVFTENYVSDSSSNFYTSLQMSVNLYTPDSLVLRQVADDGTDYHFLKTE